MDIDLVVPWVDGGDIEHIKLKNEYKKLLGKKVDSEAVIDARFKDNGELKYLLRSVEQNANFIRYVFLVTNGQKPKWLNLNNPKIRLIKHEQIMPKDSLPTFCSSAIESCIANIPNLSDQFLFANDDFFIAKPITEDFFFNKDGYPISRLKLNFHPEKRDENLELYNTRQLFTVDLFYKKFHKKMNFFEHHNIDAFYKPDVLKCIEEFKEEFDKVVHCKFRTPNTVSKMIWTFYSVYMGHSKIKNHYLSKIPLSLRFITKILYKHSLDSNAISISSKKYNMDKYKLFCLNDDELATDNDRKRSIEFLEQMFPKKSSFEM